MSAGDAVGERRIAAIRVAIEQALTPVSLQIEDQSHRHVGHDTH